MWVGILTGMVYASRFPHGGLVVGVGAFGSAVWVHREAVCHRWSVWRTRTPKAGIDCGDDEGFGSAGMREPRRPLPGGLNAQVSSTRFL
jgi:hypothetical protein